MCQVKDSISEFQLVLHHFEDLIFLMEKSAVAWKNYSKENQLSFINQELEHTRGLVYQLNQSVVQIKNKLAQESHRRDETNITITKFSANTLVPPLE